METNEREMENTSETHGRQGQGSKVRRTVPEACNPAADTGSSRDTAPRLLEIEAQQLPAVWEEVCPM